MLWNKSEASPAAGNENVKTAKFVSWLKSMGSLKSMDRRETRWHNSERNFHFSGQTIVMVKERQNCLNLFFQICYPIFYATAFKRIGQDFQSFPSVNIFCFLIGTWPICASFVVSHFMWLDWSSFLTIFLLGLKPLSMFTLMNMFDKFWEILLPQLHSRSQTFRQKKKTQKIILDKFKKTNLIDMVYFHSFLLFSTFLLFYWNPLLGIGGMVCCSKWWRTSQAPAAVGSPSSFDINTFHNCAPTKRYRRKQLESFKWLWVLAMCQREYFLEYDFWLWMFWEIFRRFFCKIFQRTVGPICGQFTKGVWEIAALAEGYVLLAIKWGSNVSAEKHPFYYCYLFR